MNKIKYLASPLIVFFGLVYTVHAGFEITEIMYDLDGTDTNREWVEVQNTGTDSVDLSTWFLFSDNTKHALVPQGVSVISSGGYAIIVQNVSKFQTDWPNFSGLLFDSSWTGFNNDGETVALKDPSLNVVGSITFTSSQGGAGDGNSLQRVSGSWAGATPTPGVDNQPSSPGGGGGTTLPSPTTSPTITTPTTLTTPTPAIVKKKEVEVPQITTDIVAPITVFAGLPFKIDAHTLGYKKESIQVGKFVWNFGDGEVMTTPVQSEFLHMYNYPGEYVVTLSYYFSPSRIVPDATDRMIVKVVPSGVSISSVGAGSDSFVELENKSDFEVALVGWTIKGLNHSFTLPEGTIILPTKKLKFSPKVTGFTPSDTGLILLQDPSGQTVATYPLPKPPTTTYKSSMSDNTSSTSESVKSDSSPAIPVSIIDLNDLGASALSADTRTSSRSLAWIGLVIVIIVGLASVLVMRRKNSETDSLEKEVSASDMTIIE